MKHHILRALIILVFLFSASYSYAAISYDLKISAYDAARSQILQSQADDPSYSVLEDQHFQAISHICNVIPGMRDSEDTNQYFNRNRYYSPALGRFTQKDPIGFNGGMNLYRYADNNPLIFTDPTGYSIAIPIPSFDPASIIWNGAILAAIYELYSREHPLDRCEEDEEEDDVDDANRPCKKSQMTTVGILIIPPGTRSWDEYGHSSLMSIAGVKGWWPSQVGINVVPGRIKNDSRIAAQYAAPGRMYRACPESQEKVVEAMNSSITSNWKFQLENIQGRNCAGWVAQVLQMSGFTPPAPPTTPFLRPTSLR